MKGRVVFLCPGLTEPGGTARRSRLIAEGLAEAGWEVRVIARSGVLRRPRFERGPGLSVVELPGFGMQRFGGAVFYLLATPLALAWGFRARTFLALQLLSTSTVTALCARILRKPFAAMASTSGELSETRYIAAQRTAPLRRALLGRARWLIAQTPEVATQLCDLVPPERITVLPNPVELPTEVPPLTGAPRVLFAGRLSEEKDLTGLLEAWGSVIAREPAARLTIAGEGGAFRSVEAQLRSTVAGDAQLAGSVEMPGWANEMAPYFRENDIFVLPSLEEGMSNALLEACAWGRIPVASAIAPNVAIVGAEHPFLFEPGDRAGMAAALLAAIEMDPSDRTDLLAELKDRIRAEFAQEAVIARLEVLLGEDRSRNQHA